LLLFFSAAFICGFGASLTLGANQSRLASALKISRQTIHNYREIYHHFGMEGLIHGYKPSDSKSREIQRKLHEHKRTGGNKAVQVAEIRASKKATNENQKPQQSQINFSFDENDLAQEIPEEQQPFSQVHGWEESRYAGCFLYWPVLIHQWKWLHLIMGRFAGAWQIFSVFLLMSGLNIRSIEQLKNIRQREAGRILGLTRLPGKTQVWSWFYEAANQKVSDILLKDYFTYQQKCGLIGFRLWFIDGHLLPYSGKEKVHYSYNTQRKIPMPGRTNQVTCDSSGRIVHFVIEEGKGKMKQQIIDVVEQSSSELPSKPIVVFDREGYDKAFFSQLVKLEHPFVTWEKNIDKAELESIPDEKFTQDFEFNSKQYSVFEQEKKFSYQTDGEEAEHTFVLRRLIIWNKSSCRRTAGLAYSATICLETKEAVQAILSRWGASENTFKHLQDRHPLRYHPGFKLVESDNQLIANPEIKKKTTMVAKLRKVIDKKLRKLNGIVDIIKKDGTLKKNKRKQSIKEEIQQQEVQLKQLREEKKTLEDKIDVSQLEDYRSFKQIDNEGKKLFDFVTTSVWNARKQMVDWLGETYENNNDVVDLFYVITHCHGWIRSTETEVRVRLEALQQSRRRAAQEFICRKLTGLGAQTPMGKFLVVEVGKSPL
jgi:hypothetical protein